MKIKLKKKFSAEALYAFPLLVNNIPHRYTQSLLKELNNNHDIYDHFDSLHPQGEYLVIFYDEHTSKTPKVVSAFLGQLEFIGYTFEESQQYGYKFRKLFEVDIFNKGDYFNVSPFDTVPVFYKFKNSKKL